jgi:hypothetical protein
MPFGLTRRISVIERLTQTFEAEQDLNNKIILKCHWEIYGSNASWIYMGFSAIERLI